jgi:hypothetical protein
MDLKFTVGAHFIIFCNTAPPPPPEKYTGLVTTCALCLQQKEPACPFLPLLKASAARLSQTGPLRLRSRSAGSTWQHVTYNDAYVDVTTAASNLFHNYRQTRQISRAKQRVSLHDVTTSFAHTRVSTVLILLYEHFGYYFSWLTNRFQSASVIGPPSSRRDWLCAAFSKLRKATISFFMSVCPHGTRLPRDRFSLNLIFQLFLNLTRKFKFH